MLGLSVIILFKSLLHIFCSLVFSVHYSSVTEASTCFQFLSKKSIFGICHDSRWSTTFGHWGLFLLVTCFHWEKGFHKKFGFLFQFHQLFRNPLTKTLLKNTGVCPKKIGSRRNCPSFVGCNTDIDFLFFLLSLFSLSKIRSEIRLAIQFLFNMWSEIQSNFWSEIFTWNKMHLCIDAQACSMSGDSFVCCSKGTQWQSKLQQLQMQQALALRRPKQNHLCLTQFSLGSRWSLNYPKAYQERCPCRTPHHSRQYQTWWEDNCQVTRPPWTWGKAGW